MRLNSFAKGFILFLRPHVLLGFLIGPLRLLTHTLELSRWISKHNRKDIFNQFYRPVYEYKQRYNLYQYLCEAKNLIDQRIVYLEFGVCGGVSFNWWLQHNKNSAYTFFGFDTFEGLPEDWGIFFKKGTMNAGTPELTDPRATFVKGLFQQVVPGFIKNNQSLLADKLVIHLDADLYTSTLYVLTSLAPYLKSGDILLFDEFGVPNHEFLAFKNFTDSYYLNFDLIGVANNFGQVAFQMR